METGQLIRQVIAATAEYKLRRGGGGGARLQLRGCLWERLRGWDPLTELDYQFCCSLSLIFGPINAILFVVLFGLFDMTFTVIGQ